MASSSSSPWMWSEDHRAYYRVTKDSEGKDVHHWSKHTAPQVDSQVVVPKTVITTTDDALAKESDVPSFTSEWIWSSERRDYYRIVRATDGSICKIIWGRESLPGRDEDKSQSHQHPQSYQPTPTTYQPTQSYQPAPTYQHAQSYQPAHSYEPAPTTYQPAHMQHQPQASHHVSDSSFSSLQLSYGLSYSSRESRATDEPTVADEDKARVSDYIYPAPYAGGAYRGGGDPEGKGIAGSKWTY